MRHSTTRVVLLCLLWPTALSVSSPAAEEEKPCGATTAVDFWNADCDATKDHCWKDVHEYANVSAEPADCCDLCTQNPGCAAGVFSGGTCYMKYSAADPQPGQGTACVKTRAFISGERTAAGEGAG